MGLPRERKHCVFKVLGHARVGDAEGTIVAKVAGHRNVTHTANDGTLQHSFQTKAMSGCTICAVTLPKGTCVGMRWQRCRKSNEIKLAPNCCARDDDGGYFSFPSNDTALSFLFDGSVTRSVRNEPWEVARATRA